MKQEKLYKDHMHHLYYLLTDILTITFPLIWSFEKKMYFYARWKYVFKTITVSTSFFLLWDMLFTFHGIWGFTPYYLTGIYIYNLPIEEVLFFITIPFSCLFIYESVFFLLSAKMKKGVLYQVSLVAGLVLFFFGIYHYDKLYTCCSCLGTSILLGYQCSGKKQINHEVLWLTYAVVLLPFIIVNGVLTGYITDSPIVWYNDTETLGIRFLTIPIEDFIYNLFLLLANVTLYERFLKRKQ